MALIFGLETSGIHNPVKWRFIQKKETSLDFMTYEYV